MCTRTLFVQYWMLLASYRLQRVLPGTHRERFLARLVCLVTSFLRALNVVHQAFLRRHWTPEAEWPCTSHTTQVSTSRDLRHAPVGQQGAYDRGRPQDNNVEYVWHTNLLKPHDDQVCEQPMGYVGDNTTTNNQTVPRWRKDLLVEVGLTE